MITPEQLRDMVHQLNELKEEVEKDIGRISNLLQTIAWYRLGDMQDIVLELENAITDLLQERENTNENEK